MDNVAACVGNVVACVGNVVMDPSLGLRPPRAFGRQVVAAAPLVIVCGYSLTDPLMPQLRVTDHWILRQNMQPQIWLQ